MSKNNYKIDDLYIANIRIDTWLSSGKVVKCYKKTIVYSSAEDISLKTNKYTDIFSNITYPVTKKSKKFKGSFDYFFIDSNQKLTPLSEFLSNKGIGFENKPYTKKEIIELCNEAKDYDNSKTLAIIKPDGMKNIEKIIEMIYESGLKIDSYKVETLDEAILSEHYSHLLNKPFYPKLQNYMMSGPVAIMILEGTNAVEKLRNLMGLTDSTKAKKNTIRGKFGTDITYNAIHGSDSAKSASDEINRFFKQKQKRI